MASIADKQVDISCISETWLFSQTSPVTSRIKSQGYSIVHNYRKNQRGGGTAIIYKSCYTVREIVSPSEFSTFESTSVAVESKGTKCVVFVVLYRTGALNNIFFQELDCFLSHICSQSDNVIVTGDMNVHFEMVNDRKVKDCLDMFMSYGFKQQIHDATHTDGGTLDQVFTFSLDRQIACTSAIDSIHRFGSDHFPIYCKLNLALDKKYFKQVTYRKLSSINQVDLITDFKNSFKAIDLSGNFGTIYSKLKSNLRSILDSHAPILTKNLAIMDEAPWFDKEYRKLRSKRRYAEKLWKKHGDPATYSHYKDLCCKATYLANCKKKAYFKKLVDKSDNNPKTLFKLVNSALDRKQLQPIPDSSKNMKELASEFNTFFSDKIAKIRAEIGHEFLPKFNDFSGNHLSEFSLTNHNEILDIIKESGIKTSPDDILPSQILKENLDIMIPIIVNLVNLSLQNGTMEGLKSADIAPLLKGVSLDHNVFKNFRPVSNLQFIGKIVERVVLRRLNEHLKSNRLNIPVQSAYKKNFSTETLLVRLTNDILIASDMKSATVVLLLDLSAAFDTVEHNLLLTILEKEIGLTGTVLKWFRSFLTARTQRTRLGNAVSEEVIIMFGVPQGSVLGPVLFNIYIRSIYSMLQRLGFSVYGYADDHQILKVFKPKEQHLCLTEDLSLCFYEIQRWMTQYYLQLNGSKTQIILFGPHDVLNDIPIGGTFLSQGITIRFAHTVKNLGVLMDSSLTMSNQVINIKKTCFNTLRKIAKIRFLLSKEHLKTVVNSLVVSCLDYCNALYYGIGQKLQLQLQQIQNAASKLIMGKYKYSHMKDDLNKLHWLSVKKRVIFKIALLVYKSVNGIAPPYLQQLFGYVSHGNTIRLDVPHTNSKLGARAFSVIGPKIYNSLPSDVKESSNIMTFKQKLKTYLFSKCDFELNYFS